MLFDHPPMHLYFRTRLEEAPQQLQALRSSLSNISKVTGPIDLLVYPAGAGDGIHLAYARNLLIYDETSFLHDTPNPIDHEWIQREEERTLWLYFHRGYEEGLMASGKYAAPTMLASLSLLGLDRDSARVIRHGHIQGLQFEDSSGPRYIFFHQAHLGFFTRRIVSQDIKHIAHLVRTDNTGILIKGDWKHTARVLLNNHEFSSYIIGDPKVQAPPRTSKGKTICWSPYYLNNGKPPSESIFFGYSGPQVPIRIGLAQR